MFERSDQNNDGIVTEDEALTNINRAVVWELTRIIDYQMPKEVFNKFRNGGITLSEFIRCVITKLNCSIKAPPRPTTGKYQWVNRICRLNIRQFNILPNY